MYIHVPFCHKKCDYCGFYSTVPAAGSVDRYLQRLIEESEYCRARCHETVNTVFVGGGNPTALGAQGVAKLVELIETWADCSSFAEVTFETNPESLTVEILDLLRNFSGLRLSMGVQRLADEELELLGRQARLDSVYRALDLACSRLDNVSVDLILGVPGCQPVAGQLEALVRRFDLKHVSAYFLTVEDDTPLQRRILAGELQNPSEIGPEELYLVREVLLKNGFEHYEISNYARPGYRCQHNLNYWQAGNYIGLGPSAVSCCSSCRSANVPDLELWLAGALPEIENLSETERRNEFVMLSLRLLLDGLDLGSLQRHFGPQPNEFSAALQTQLTAGNLWRSGDRVCLSDAGLAVADNVMASLFI